MNTPLPFANFAVCAMVLSDHHLDVALYDARKVQDCLQGRLLGYSTHPVVAMWRKNMLALMMYGDCMLRELHRRGHNPKRPLMLTSEFHHVPFLPDYAPPEWLGDFRFHSQQRGILLRKNPEWYGQWGWTDDDPGRDAFLPVVL